MKTDRATAIRQTLFSNGHMSIPEIAEAVGASEPTVRRDLAALELDGAITRTHGGAQIADASATEIEFESREQINLEAKRAIGEAAYAQLRPGSVVFLDAGTTVLQLARLIRLRPMALSVFTNCLPVAQMLMPLQEVSVALLGGTLRMQNASMVGPLAEAALDQLWFDQLFLGATAIAPDLSIYSTNENEARLNRLMLGRAEQSIVLTDSSKLGARATHRVMPLDSRMSIITDAGAATDWTAKIAETGAGLSIVDPK
ncbi:DeoR family transcriptional regulator [Yoonia maricola]|uniref:DeoR family transcriptional regulator n=1 Tax=Yoonia maricola TaxID=420999 RepID=A0A2M8WLR8_9RHOB|nr:DeoR/GlpR family DNA-binding transcription regulator [Yoonia maricola]PJI91870.1 DeoR family transcriptional regulator [Yoonia maricola]